MRYDSSTYQCSIVELPERDCQRLEAAIWPTEEDVRQEVRERMRTIGKGGGLVIAPSHVIPPEAPWDNVLAFFDAVEEFGRYV